MPGLPRTELEERVLVLAPTPRDGQLCRSFLQDAGFQVHLCRTPRQVCEELDHGAGALLLSLEAVRDDTLQMLKSRLSDQPRWSELPVLLITPQNSRLNRIHQSLDAIPNVVLVERPLRVNTLQSLVGNALRARERQYQIRGHLELQEQAYREREVLLEREKEARQQAEAASRAKSQFLANVSHEIRTPMYGILGMTEVLEKTPLGEEQMASVQTILDCGRALLELMDDLIDLGRIEAGKLTLDYDRFRPRDLLEETISLFGSQAGERGIELSGQVAPEVPAVMRGPASRVRQIVVNLLNNSLKFTHQGAVSAEFSYPRAGLLIEIRDSGVGIPEDKREEIYNAFSQLDSSASRRYPGAGLGLSIVRHLVSLMGGEIEVQSELGQGTTFRIWLPLKATDEASHGNGRPTSEVSDEMKRSLRILVAEDNPMVARVLSTQLAQLGYQADVVGNGQKVLDACREGTYHLVLLDCQMPVLDGYDTARQMSRWKSPPVLIASTAHAMAGERERCLSLGMDDYLSKPISVSKLEEVLSRWCATALKRAAS